MQRLVAAASRSATRSGLAVEPIPGAAYRESRWSVEEMSCTEPSDGDVILDCNSIACQGKVVLRRASYFTKDL